MNAITIENYKCFESQRIELGGLTVLAGMNGAGKSSVIQSLLLLRQSFEQGTLRDGRLALNGEYVSIGTAKDALFEKALSDTIAFSIDYNNSERAKWSFVANSIDDVVKGNWGPVPMSVFEEPLFKGEFNYLQAERIGPRTVFPTSDHMVRRRKKLGNQGEYSAAFLSYFGRRIKVSTALCKKGATSSDLIDQVEAWMDKISPGTRLHTTTFEGTDSINLQYSFAFENDTAGPYRATNVGFGITYTLPVLIALLTASQKSLVIIENPEAHLHPKGQVLLGKLLATAATLGGQIVVETHSDHVVNGIRLALHGGRSHPKYIKLYYCRRQQGDSVRPSVVSQIEVDSNGRFSSRPSGFFDEFNCSLDRLLDVPTPYGDSVDI